MDKPLGHARGGTEAIMAYIAVEKRRSGWGIVLALALTFAVGVGFAAISESNGWVPRNAPAATVAYGDRRYVAVGNLITRPENEMVPVGASRDGIELWALRKDLPATSIVGGGGGGGGPLTIEAPVHLPTLYIKIGKDTFKSLVPIPLSVPVR